MFLSVSGNSSAYWERGLFLRGLEHRVHDPGGERGVFGRVRLFGRGAQGGPADEEVLEHHLWEDTWKYQWARGWNRLRRKSIGIRADNSG